MIDLSEKKVLPTKLLVRESIKENKKTPSGLFIPDTASRITCEGTAVVCGEGTPSVRMVVAVGQTVLFAPHASIKVKIGDDDFLLLNITDILLFW